MIRGSLDEVWRRTQDPVLHQKWDLRFTEIRYLPRQSETDPQQFLYSTRIGFGLGINGRGESLGKHDCTTGEAISALRFRSDEAISLIREGSGYWRYTPEPEGVRFLTWYDYNVRFGLAGKTLDRLLFRPLLGWATAWSFDRLRLWIEQEMTPSTAMALSIIHALARCTIAFTWAWHGLVPKLLYRNLDELNMLVRAGLSIHLLPFLVWAEIVFAIAMLVLWRSRGIFIVNFL